MLVVTAGWATHVGLVRDGNEDAGYVGRRLWAVADGMGGHAAGEVASGLVVEALAELDESESLDRESLVEGVRGANDRLRAYSADHARTRGMGTTLTGVAVVGQEAEERLCVFNIGDSRVYRLAGDAVEQVTLDHSEVGELVAEGILTPEEALFHPLRNILTRCLGMWPFPGVDTWPLEVTDGVRLLICSDGLTGEVSDARLASILRDLADPQEAADALVAAALEAGGHDNVTVIVLDVAPG